MFKSSLHRNMCLKLRSVGYLRLIRQALNLATTYPEDHQRIINPRIQLTNAIRITAWRPKTFSERPFLLLSDEIKYLLERSLVRKYKPEWCCEYRIGTFEERRCRSQEMDVFPRVVGQRFHWQEHSTVRCSALLNSNNPLRLRRLSAVITKIFSGEYL